MARPMWTGAISFGLVTIPVKLYNAVSKKSISFNQLNAETGNRIRYRKIDAGTEDEVPDEQIIKGFEISKGRYVHVDPDELEPFLPQANRAIELEEFVDLADIDPVFFDSPYLLAPDKMPKPYALLTKAMEATGKVGVGRFVMRNKEYVAAVRASEGHLLLSTLVYADEVVPANDIPEIAGLEDVDVSEKELAMATQLVDSLAGPFEPERFPDTYREKVLELIEKKAAGEELEVAPAAEASPKVVDLMAALEASVAAAKQARGRHPSAGTRKAAEPTSPEQAETAPAKGRSKKAKAHDGDDGDHAEEAATKRRVRKSA
jgi:DNA end-binding protein Ku